MLYNNAKMKTQQKNFRLSEQAIANLAAIADRSGVNETAAVEMALAALANGLTRSEMTDIKMTLTRMAQQAARDANERSQHGQAMISAARGFICKPTATDSEVAAAIKQLRECQEIFGSDPAKVLAAAATLKSLRAN